MMRIVGHVGDVPEFGNYLCLPWTSGREAVVVNAGDRGIVAFFNACPHRGASLLPQGRGTCDPLAVACRYHGRRFAAEVLERLSLHVSPGGWLVAGDSGCDGSEFSRLLHAVDDVAGPTAGLRFFSEERLVVWADWRVVVENALDREHVATVHRDTLARLRLHRYGLQDFGHGSSLELFYAGDERASARLERLAPSLRGEAGLAHHSCDYFHAMLFPHSALSAMSGGVFFLQAYLPLASAQRADPYAGCLVMCRTYCQPGASKAAVAAVVAANARVLGEDARACELVKAWRPGLPAGPLDDRIRLFRSQLSDFKGESL